MEDFNNSFPNLMVIGQLVLRYSCQDVDPMTGDDSVNIYARCIGIANAETGAALIEISRLNMQRNPITPTIQHSSSPRPSCALPPEHSKWPRSRLVRQCHLASPPRLPRRLLQQGKHRQLVIVSQTNQAGRKNQNYNSPAYSSSPASPTQNLIFSR